MATSLDGNERSNSPICPHCGRPVSAMRALAARPLPPVEPLRSQFRNVTPLRARS